MFLTWLNCNNLCVRNCYWALLTDYVIPRCVMMKEKNTWQTDLGHVRRLSPGVTGLRSGRRAAHSRRLSCPCQARVPAQGATIQLVRREASELLAFREQLSTRWGADHCSTIPLTESVTCGKVCHPWCLASVISPHIWLPFTSTITFMTPSLFCGWKIERHT